MKNFMEIARQEVRAFHKGEEGLTTVESMLLLGGAVLVMIGLVKWVQPNVMVHVTQKVKDLINNTGVSF